MNWYKKSQYKKTFIGNCVSGLENDVLGQICGDATELAQIVENGELISEEQFFTMCAVADNIIKIIKNNPRYEFYYNREEDMAWYYDNMKDIEYFYN
jgi:hypothetical protein